MASENRIHPRVTILAGLFLAAAGMMGAGPPRAGRPTFGPGNRVFRFPYEGQTRMYIVHVPPSYRTDRDYPVVFALHGGGGNARSAVGNFGLKSLADREGFLVVYPEGSAKEVLGKRFATWNAGRCCGPAAEEGVDDVGFLRQVIERVQRDYYIDPARIYVTGMSNGAQMAYRLACELSDLIAAVVPVASVGTYEDCRPSRPMPILHIHGKEDPCARYEGGICGGCIAKFLRLMGLPARRKGRWACASVPDFIRGWAQRNGCSLNTEVEVPAEGVACTHYLRCPQQADVVLCTIQDHGHVWPGRRNYSLPACRLNPQGRMCTAWKRVVGPIHPFPGANAWIWKFMREHPHPGKKGPGVKRREDIRIE